MFPRSCRRARQLLKQASRVHSGTHHEREKVQDGEHGKDLGKPNGRMSVKSECRVGDYSP